MSVSLASGSLVTAYSRPAAEVPKAVLDGIGGAAPHHAPTIASMSMDWPKKCNAEAAMMEAVAYALGPGIVQGLSLSASGLAMTVADGIALLDGVVSVRNLSTVALPASQSRVWIYLTGAGVVQTTQPVSGPWIVLGSVQTGASAIVGSFDTSGVLYVMSGTVWRSTNDATAPADTLNANIRVHTKTQDGVYLWTGSSHVKIT